MQDPKQTLDKPIAEIDNYHKFEIQEIFAFMRTANTLRIQIYSFFGTVNITILALALDAKKAGLILFAASIIVVLILVDAQMHRYYSVIFSRGIELEDLYAPDKERAFFHKYFTQSNFIKRGWIERYSLALFILNIEIMMAILSWLFLKWNWF